MKSLTVASGSSPTSIAYARMNARPKIPPGNLEKSLRSTASSAATEIFVVPAMSRRDRPRDSRAPSDARQIVPCSVWTVTVPEVSTSSDVIHGRPERLGRAHGPERARVTSRRKEHADSGDAGGAGGDDGRASLRRDAADRQERHSARGRRPRAGRRGPAHARASAPSIRRQTPCRRASSRRSRARESRRACERTVPPSTRLADSARTSGTGGPSARRCTPSAPAASATSARSFTRTRTGARAAALDQTAREPQRARAPSRSRSRI